MITEDPKKVKLEPQGDVVAVLGTAVTSPSTSSSNAAVAGERSDVVVSTMSSSTTLRRYALAEKYCVRTATAILTPEECGALIARTESESAGYERALVNADGSGRQVLDEVRTGARCVLELPLSLERAIFDRLRGLLPERFAAHRDKGWKYQLTYGQKKIAHWILDGKSFKDNLCGKREIDAVKTRLLPSGVEQEEGSTTLATTHDGDTSSSPSPTKSTAWRLAGLNPRFRFLRYRQGEKFGPHFDGSYSAHFAESPNIQTAKGDGSGRFWQVAKPGSSRPKQNNPDPVLQRSFLTVMLYLTDSAGSGFTCFLDEETERVIGSCAPRAGTGLIFEHDMYHEGAPIELPGEVKYAVRTDAMYVREEDWDAFCRVRTESDGLSRTDFPKNIREFEQLVADARFVDSDHL